MAATAKKTVQATAKAPATSSSESDSDSEMSVQVLERMEEDKVETVERPNKNVWRNVDPRKKCIRRHRLTSTILDNVDTTGIEELAYHEMTRKQG
jgi:phenylalanine-4-hydroxylase